MISPPISRVDLGHAKINNSISSEYNDKSISRLQSSTHKDMNSFDVPLTSTSYKTRLFRRHNYLLSNVSCQSDSNLVFNILTPFNHVVKENQQCQ